MPCAPTAPSPSSWIRCEDGGFRIIEAVTFDPRPALNLLRAEWPDAVVAVEELGVGFKVERARSRMVSSRASCASWRGRSWSPTRRPA